MGKKLCSYFATSFGCMVISKIQKAIPVNLSQVVVVVKEIDVRFSIATLVSFNVFLVTFTVSIANIMADTLRTQTSRKRWLCLTIEPP